MLRKQNIDNWVAPAKFQTGERFLAACSMERCQRKRQDGVVIRAFNEIPLAKLQSFRSCHVVRKLHLHRTKPPLVARYHRLDDDADLWRFTLTGNLRCALTIPGFLDHSQNLFVFYLYSCFDHLDHCLLTFERFRMRRSALI